MPATTRRHIMATHEKTDPEVSIRTIPMAQVSLGQRELRAVERVLKNGYLRAGPLTEEFERRFAQAVGTGYAIAVNSGTAALHVALLALVDPGDDVIVPDFTFVATASMVAAVGAKPVLADVDPETYTLDPDDVERKLTGRTRAIIPVHLYGHPAPVRQLSELARRHRLRIIWDAAQAHGARYLGRDVGSFADAVCYSFYPTKNMTTGEGGMVTTADAKLATTLRLLRSHGEQSRYLHVRLGFNFRLTDIAAAIGLEQLRRLQAAVRRRQRNAAFLTRGLKDIPGLVTPRVADGVAHAFNLYTIRIDPDQLRMTRDEFQKALAEGGVDTAVHYPRPLHGQPVFAGLGEDQDFPVSTRLAETVLSLPVHPDLKQSDLRNIIRAVREVVGRRQTRGQEFPCPLAPSKRP